MRTIYFAFVGLLVLAACATAPAKRHASATCAEAPAGPVSADDGCEAVTPGHRNG